MPPANLAEPGWTVRQGQAVWRPNRTKPEIAGELLVGTRNDRECFIQFVKTPFPLVTAQANATGWKIQFPTQNKSYAGPGKPPSQIIWFSLSSALSGDLPPKRWTWQTDTNGWRLSNKRTGEFLEGYFAGNDTR